MFTTYIYNPIFSVLLYFYEQLSFGDLGIAIVLLTLAVRIVLFPIFYKGAKDQVLLQKIAPKLREIQTKHKADKEKQVQATMALYKEHQVNPFSPILLLIVQLPILIALYKVFLEGIKDIPDVNTVSLGIIDLAVPNILMAVLAAIVQYFLTKLSMPKTNKSDKNLSMAEQVGKQMAIFGPLITLVILYNLPSALGLYWLTTSVFSVIQQIVINKRLNINKEIKEEEKKLKS